MAKQPKPTLDVEKEFGYPSSIIAGVDEVGRGCLAGPVVTCALTLPKTIDFSQAWISEIADSKFLKPETRQRLKTEIENWALAWNIGVATVEEIDRINIYQATLLAMKRAVEGLSQKPNHILIDGNALPKDLGISATTVIKGDQKCLSIAAASILAKVWRDDLMSKLDTEFQGYGLAVHKGYATPQHRKAIQELGICSIHRKSFKPISDRLLSPSM